MKDRVDWLSSGDDKSNAALSEPARVLRSLGIGAVVGISVGVAFGDLAVGWPVFTLYSTALYATGKWMAHRYRNGKTEI